MDTIGDGLRVGKAGKADFDAIYGATDPRDYFRVLYGLDYIIPDLARNPLRAIIQSRARMLGRRVKVLDVGCSYGVNAALLRYPLDMRRLAERYGSAAMLHLSPSELELLDRQYYAAWPKQIDASFVGLDTSVMAIDYARSVGLIADGMSTDLESKEPSAADVRMLQAVDVVISTGCVGYVSHRTFDRILACQRKAPPLVASFVLRMFPYDDIEESLGKRGLRTEKLEGVTFVQRRFHSRAEYDATLARLAARGIDPAGKEADGLLHAELYVSRPAAEVEAVPLGDLISVTSGESRHYGRRFRSADDGSVWLLH